MSKEVYDRISESMKSGMKYHYCVMAVLDVLRDRGLINEQGLEIIKREME